MWLCQHLDFGPLIWNFCLPELQENRYLFCFKTHSFWRCVTAATKDYWLHNSCKEVKEQATCISREWELLAERGFIAISLEMEACLMWLRTLEGGTEASLQWAGKQRKWAFRGLEDLVLRFIFSSCEMRSHWRVLSTGTIDSDLYYEQLNSYWKESESFCMSVCGIDNRL